MDGIAPSPGETAKAGNLQITDKSLLRS